METIRHGQFNTDLANRSTKLHKIAFQTCHTLLHATFFTSYRQQKIILTCPLELIANETVQLVDNLDSHYLVPNGSLKTFPTNNSVRYIHTSLQKSISFPITPHRLHERPLNEYEKLIFNYQPKLPRPNDTLSIAHSSPHPKRNLTSYRELTNCRQ